MSWFSKKKNTDPVKFPKQHIRWFEIPANDFDRAVSFYANVFRMEVNVVQLNGVRHGIFRFGEGQVKGAIVDNGTSENKNGIVLFFDGYPSLGDIEAKIISNGGKILVSKTLIKDAKEDGSSVIPKNFIDGGLLGYYAYFLDTEGNKMGLYGSS